MNRRQFITTSMVAAFGLSACGDNASTPPRTTGDTTTGAGSNTSANSNRYFIPPQLSGQTVNGRTQYDLNLQTGTMQFKSGVSTATWGINGNFLGPTLRLRHGEQIDINFTNHLPETTTMHGHGMHLPAIMDGNVHQRIQPGQTWSSHFTVKQHACTNWYHPHQMAKTADHVIKGLAGLIIIDDADSTTLDLPAQYGVDDIPVIVQDRRFNADGSFNYAPNRMEIMQGWKGDHFLVNGVIDPVLDIVAKQVRFRLLNGSNARVYDFAFASGRSFQLIATDNALLESPVTLTSIRLSPAERAEIVVDFSADLGQTESFIDKLGGNTLFSININETTPRVTALPGRLITLPTLDPALASKTRSFVLSARRGVFMINGKAMNERVINETVPVNTIEIWDIRNAMGVPHNFHIHATHFQILERNGSSANVRAYEKGFKDTVYLGPHDRVKFITQMLDYQDANNPYMYHCHILEHEDAGMMGQFVVV